MVTKKAALVQYDCDIAIEAEMMKRNMKFYPQNEPIRNKL